MVGGDLIVAINGERVEDAQDLAHAMNNLKAGDTATVTVWRGKKKVDVKVALQEVRADRRA
jgi:S1-C subfamily serine protease